MLVMILTAIAVGFFALIATGQYRRATSHPHLDDNGKPNLTSYYFFVIVCVAILATVAGLRHYVGADYGGYYWRYPNWSAELEDRLREWDEPGLSVLARLLSFFTDDGAYFILLISVITITFTVFPMSKHTDDFFMSVMLYIFTGCWDITFNAVRQCVAAAIIFAGHRLIYERKFIKFCILVFIAASFHISALIMLPLYFLVTKNLNFRKIAFIMIAGIALSLSYDFIFSALGVAKGEETIGTSQYAQNEINPLRVGIAFAPVILYLFHYLQKKQFSGEENFYISMLFINASLIFATSNSAYLHRVTIFFTPFICIAMVSLTTKFDHKQHFLMKSLILILYSIVWYFASLASMEEWQWIFQRTTDFYAKYM